MPPAHLHVIGLSLGSVSGYCAVTVPRNSIFGYARSQITDRRAGEFRGPSANQAVEIARLVRGIQSLDYMVGPAIAIEESYSDELDTEDLIQLRIGSMLVLLKHQGQLGDAKLIFQPIALEMDDRKLRRLGLLYNKDYVNDAAVQALTALSRARNNFEFARSLWPYRAGADGDEIGE
jgi:hypothetical protein